jgi:hypothetical protein
MLPIIACDRREIVMEKRVTGALSIPHFNHSVSNPITSTCLSAAPGRVS